VGIRIPKSEVILAVTRALGRPVISTTARREGEDPFVDPDEIDDNFKGLAMVLDGGAGGMTHTTVIDLTKSPPEVVREGAGPIDAFGG
jgi:tRNA A37 threonylcarbamoyladenosine synthetase subunit TsaC/SUA5/YrdC